jgi:hypothetical protein
MSNNSILKISIGIGVATGAVLLYTQTHRKKRTLLGRTRDTADGLLDRAMKLRDAATDFIEKSVDEAARQKKGILHAVEAGKVAYQKVAG